MVFGAATLSPGDARTAVAAGALGAAAFRPCCFHKAAHVWFSIVVAGGVAVAVAGGPLDMGEPSSAVRLVAAAAAFVVTSHALAVAATLIGSRAARRDLLGAVPLAGFHAGVAATIGVLAAALADRPWLLPLLAVPLAAVVGIGYAADHARLQQRRAGVLLEAARSATAADDADEVVARLVAAAGEMTGAPARLAADAAGPPAVCVPLPEAFAPLTHLVVDPLPQDPVRGEPEPGGDLQTLAAVAGTALANVRLRTQLREQATTDELTRLGNRRLFNARLDAAFRRAQRGHPFGVLFVDLDGFKAVNDRLGHDAGDELLRAVATRLRRSVRAADEVFRLGGDEFTVVVDGVFDEDGLHAAAAGVERGVAGPVEVGGDAVDVRATVGGAVWDPSMRTPDALVRTADARMLAAKPAGRPTRR